MKIIFLLAVLLANLPAASAQPAGLPELNYQGKNYWDYFSKSIRYPSVLKDACATSVAFTVVRFQIDEKGKFALLTVEGSVSDSIKEYLKTQFVRTSGHWAWPPPMADQLKPGIRAANLVPPHIRVRLSD